MSNDGTPNYIFQGPNLVSNQFQSYYLIWNDYPAKTGPVTFLADGIVTNSGNDPNTGYAFVEVL